MKPMNTNPSSIVVDQAVERSFIMKVFGWMTLALAVTGLVATATAANETMRNLILGNPISLLVLFITQIVVVIVLSGLVNRINAGVATALFIIYSAITGLTFSSLFIVFTFESIGQVFFITAGTFGLVSLYGYTTRRDLTSLGSLGIMALIGIILASVINFLLRSDVLYWIISIIAIIVFIGLIAYDTQRIKRMAAGVLGSGDDELQRKASINGALALYLDFINLFIRLLMIFGRRR